MIVFTDTENKIIDILNDKGIDRISMAGVLGTLRDNNLDEDEFLRFIKDKTDLDIEDCTDKLWNMRGYY